MPINPEAHHRCSIRLDGYDYTQHGAYFVTLCTQHRRCLFGAVAEGEMQLNALGRIVEECWLAILDHFPHVEIDALVIMPNHLHGIIVITGGVVAQHAAPLQTPTDLKHPNPSIPNVKAGSVGAIARSFKSAATKRINECWCASGDTVWQRNYYERIIRDEKELNDTRQYIEANPARWAEDIENPAFEGQGG